MFAGIVGAGIGLVAGLVVGCALAIARNDSGEVMSERADHFMREWDRSERRRRLAESDCSELRYVCGELRQMLEGHPNRCEWCDEHCPFDGMCVLDGRLESLGVCVPEPRTGFASQCAEEDE